MPSTRCDLYKPGLGKRVAKRDVFRSQHRPILSSPKPGFRSGPHRFSHMERLRRSESWRSESRSPVSAECIANMYLPARNICAGTWLTPATSAPGLGSSPPHLRRDWAHPANICAETTLNPASSAPRLCPPLSHLHQSWPPCHPPSDTAAAAARLSIGRKRQEQEQARKQARRG